MCWCVPLRVRIFLYIQYYGPCVSEWISIITGMRSCYRIVGRGLKSLFAVFLNVMSTPAMLYKSFPFEIILLFRKPNKCIFSCDILLTTCTSISIWNSPVFSWRKYVAYLLQKVPSFLSVWFVFPLTSLI